ncbi:MAG TPA: glutamine amidotransferase [Phycisphaerae bacterium]|nr:glutamine amidotransferase [Phycisphaerae bacterium]HPS52032.1 glutamine amidotransferase [Phycisphaerae bacterium]
MNTKQNSKRILYAGDTSLTTAAAYLAGIMTHYGRDFDYLASNQPLADAPHQHGYALYIISDYPVNNWTDKEFKNVADDVEQGAGLIMLGGWESYCGLGGNYQNTPIADILPVKISPFDDRVNSPVPCLIEVCRKHPIIDALPFDRPPAIGGYNRVTLKPGSQEILSLRPIDIIATGGGYDFAVGTAEPLLVTGCWGDGRVACLTTDVAPHWVGTLVDWGMKRITAKAPHADSIEVGENYAKFFNRIIGWTLGEKL